ncbi:GNAT family N-acetyltransferase [Caproiciproducens faecalis]|uniref:GNAT family N-acetyltransferase n=1 Tax=Caproiciproducens faecalis TaxID=2820301 RepID=A0ABS7DN22_9FIRM|nr:GNAT family N-acetyltransferase [Caproiciproducens faecalis]MBW7572694.1 GNAT family N-acetyltransferase [Caproiciproducens faecalis]
MIKKVEYEDALSSFGATAFGCQILSAAEAYGLNEPFAQFWVQEGTGTLLCKLDDALILDAGSPDFDELTDFIRMTGANRLLCSSAAAKQTGFPVTSTGQIMVYENAEPVQARFLFEKNPGLRDIYALLSACATESFTPPEFEPFYMDMSHRIRHDTAAAVGIRQGDTLVSCAVCSARTNETAVLSAVCVDPGQRCKGLGHETLSALISQLPGRRIFILRTQDENEDFYRSYGFTACGEFSEMKI